MPQAPKRILIVAATSGELPDTSAFDQSKLQIETLVTGVGMVATTFSLTQKLTASEFDLVLNIGIAGSFSDEIELGEVVNVHTDRLVELGAEDHGKFLPADEMKLVDTKDLLFSSDVSVNGLRNVAGITVNRVHGNAESIRKVKEQFNPDVESMEGAAVGYVCSKIGIPWVQLRSVSNRVEPRNTANWNIPLAIKNLHQQVSVYLQKLNDEA
ncbi:MAG: futalosine hydrolase [Flavobacteriales bacterium]|nr:futalosine hydrolase [Flavobacteriales bacterium]